MAFDQGATISAALAKHNVTLSIAAPVTKTDSLKRLDGTVRGDGARSEVGSMRMTSRSLPSVLAFAVLGSPSLHGRRQGAPAGTRVIVRAVTTAATRSQI